MPIWKRSHAVRSADSDEWGSGSDEAELIAAAKHDPQAFAVLYEQYYQTVYFYCYRRVGSPEQADDATSTIFLKAFAAISRFRPHPSRPGATFRSWLFSIAHNVVVDGWRRQRGHLSLDAQGEEAFPEPFIDPGRSPEELAIDAEADRRVRDLLGQLPERQRQVVELRLAGLSSNEVANVLNLSLPAAKSLQFRAYRALRELIQVRSPEMIRELPQ